MLHAIVLAVLLICCSAHWSTAAADVSAFVAAVGFDEDGGMGVGVRWGKSSGLIGGETSLMIARPQRDLPGSEETATAIFYEGRFLINIPTGSSVQPFIGVGFGMITLTSTDVPTGTDPAVSQAMGAVADAQTNKALSYGGGVRYALGERQDLRVDLRQYSVFSVTSLVQDAVLNEVGVELPDELTEDNTVQYSEFSVGVNIRF
jgi:opacity protein-like surface antigen